MLCFCTLFSVDMGVVWPVKGFGPDSLLYFQHIYFFRRSLSRQFSLNKNAVLVNLRHFGLWAINIINEGRCFWFHIWNGSSVNCYNDDGSNFFEKFIGVWT